MPNRSHRAGNVETASAYTLTEPIAVIGMSCRFPGGIDSPDQLWEVVQEGRDAIGPFPSDRGWNLGRLVGGTRDENATGTSVSSHGGFLYDAADFDAGFFNVSPREARFTDPQHRIMLELAWEAIERGQMDPTSLRDSRTGVFLGQIWDDYGDRFLADLLQSDNGFGEYEGFFSVGNSRGVLSGRISYLLGLTGPAITVDTSCSSSLVALHLAMQSLRSGECPMALAGGITVMSSPSFIVDFSRQGAFSPDGRSKAFAAGADGMGVGEGGGLLLLERLTDALHLQHPIAAVIRGSAINQDGASDGQIAPSQQAQERVIMTALANAGLEPKDIAVVDAHGTGTMLGDYVEAQALLATYGQHRLPDQPLWLGSFKSNVGHSQAGAGVGSMIKMIMAMRHGVMPKSLHVNQPTPKVDWATGDVRVLSDERFWDQGGEPRRSAVSSFGISGTNAHVILEQYLDERPASGTAIAPAATGDERTAPVVLSAKSPESLRLLASRLRDLVNDRSASVADIAWSSIHTRALHDHRAIALSANHTELIGQLNNISVGSSDPHVTVARARGRKLMFVFPGQGAQWVSMGKELLGWSAAFAERLRECDEALAPYVDWSVVSTVSADDPGPLLERVDVVQPCLFAMMVSLDAMWRSFGVEPAGVVGHSQGEIAALCTTGALSLDDAARTVAVRSKALAEISGHGAMASILASKARVEELAARYADVIEIAAINSSRSLVVAGTTEAITDLLGECASLDVEAQRLPVSYASHSSHIEPLEAQLRRSLAAASPSAATVPFYSSLSGGLLDTASLTGDYWYENLRCQVDFQSAVQAALNDGFDTFVEISPHPVLVPAIEQISEDARTSVVATGTLRRNEGGARRFLQGASAVHCAGVAINWDRCFDGITPATVDLPTYPFFRKRYWVDPPRRASHVDGRLVHPMLSPVQLTGHGDLTGYAGSVSQRTHRWLADHKVHGQVIFPGTAFLEIAMFLCASEGFQVIDELTIVAPLAISHGQTVEVQAALRRTSRQRAEISIQSRTPGAEGQDTPWTLNASGFLAESPISATSAVGAAAALTPWPPRGAVRIDVEAFYDELRDRGYEYGPALRGVERAWISAGAAHVEVQLPASVDDRTAAYQIHPAALDAGLQLCATGALLPTAATLALPFSWQRVTLPKFRSDHLRVTIERTSDREVSVAIADEHGAALASIESLLMRDVVDCQADAAGGPTTQRTTPEPIAEMEIGWERVRRDQHDESWPIPEHLTFLAGPDSPRDVVGAIDWTPSITALVDDLQASGQLAPPLIVCLLGHGSTAGQVDASPTGARDAVVQALSIAQEFLGSDRLEESYLVMLTNGAIDTGRGELVDPASTAVWGLVRSIQREDPGRIVIVDVEHGRPVVDQLRVALATGSSQVAVRQGKPHVPRLRQASGAGIDIGSSQHWQLVTSGDGLVDGIDAEPRSSPSDPGAEEVVVSVRAAGIAFRDVMIAHNIYPESGPLGREVAGVVLSTGAGVNDLAVGDRVFGYCSGAFADTVIADHRHLVRMPDDWTFAEAAAIPAAYLTAYHALIELAHLTSAESILIHSAASGTGMAAVYLAQHIGADVFVTASPNKHQVLRDMGIAEDHIASSRSADFADQFRDVRGGQGFDVAIDAFSGSMVDATLGLMKHHGRFIEIGWRDVRRATDVAAEYDGVGYHAVNMTKFEPAYYRQTFSAIVELISSGRWAKLPIRCWDIRQCRQAVRFMSAGQQIGKHVVVMPRRRTALSDGTVVISGGTGMAGAHTARHLVRSWGCRSLALISRTGGDSSAMNSLRSELSSHGAEVHFLVGDIADEQSVAELLQRIPSSHPIVGVIHAAGLLDDVMSSDMKPSHIDSVFAPKVVGAWNLHRLTKDIELSFFVVYSSIAGSIGSPGQANYAAANAYLDGLVAFRSASGMPATSTVWGLWNQPSSLTRLALSSSHEPLRRLGVRSFDVESALRTLDRAVDAPSPVVLCARFDQSMPALGAPQQANSDEHLPSQTQPAEFAARTTLTGDVDEALVAVNREIATTLGLESSDDIDAEKPFRAIGFDSLTAVELRNRLNVLAGLRLPTTVVFDCMTPQRLAELIAELSQ
jgi:polyketide synthase 12